MDTMVAVLRRCRCARLVCEALAVVLCGPAGVLGAALLAMLGRAAPWAAARPRAVRAASFARRVVSKPGQASPPPTGPQLGRVDQVARLSETAIAFVRSCSCGIETAIAFAGAKWVFWCSFRAQRR